MKIRTAILAAALAITAPCAPCAAQPHPRLTSTARAELEARMKRFIGTVRSERADSITQFFPSHGTLVWVHTLHRSDRKHIGVWRIPAAELPRAMHYDGPLSASFYIQVDGQPIGLFLHQVIVRELRRQAGWRLVGTRFVPAGEHDRAGLFVEWRREGGEWVVATYGDEGFQTAKLPLWCC